ncbi:hypothetical protein J6TS1_40170 [Siminovitchia terrae]|uniref:Uncharacterized protein n=1 Tax=Siminovitchia terrae TaxID=1914933 RepID=A0ABQ4L1I7_SIMTE|nr:hypothetical protein [Siminovitchia terrae]GIN89441.1 hypothetical protein J22TS1_04920 [Siminovitchia terrae]GIN98147.1 hypothetical protein J6TS1_40170 [Siminovitchia terrae]
MDQLKDEYIKITKSEHKYLAVGVILASMVFVVPFLIIITNGWWEPLGSASDGWKWVFTSIVLLSLIYVSLLFDKFYRKH